MSHGFLAGIFGTLDRFGVVVDLISTSEVHVSMAIEDNLSRKIMDRLVSELHKKGSVSLIPRDCAHDLSGTISPIGHCSRRHGDPLARRETDAQLGGHVWTDVPNPRPRQRQHRDDQSRRERDQHLVCHMRERRSQGAQLDPPELSANQTGRRSWKRCVPFLFSGVG